MHDRRNVRVLVFPADDAALRGEVEHTLDRLPEGGSDDQQVETLRAELRPWYRSLSVHVRDSFGGYDGDPVPTWYVYRDGRVRRPDARLERLYRAIAVARETCRSSETAIATSLSVAELAGFRDAVRRPAPSGPEAVTAARRDREEVRT